MQPLAYQIKQNKKVEDILYDGEAKEQGQGIPLTKSAINYRFLLLVAENNRCSMLYPWLNHESSCSFGNFYLFNNGYSLTLTNTTYKIKQILGVK